MDTKYWNFLGEEKQVDGVLKTYQHKKTGEIKEVFTKKNMQERLSSAWLEYVENRK